MSGPLRLVLGVDPGKKGALALLTPDAEIHDVVDMPAAEGHGLGVLIASYLAGHGPHEIVAAFVERVNYRPGQSGGWTFATNNGAILGALGALGIPTETIVSTRWKASQGCTIPADTPKKEKDKLNKTTSRLVAMSRWPEHADTFKRVKDDGRSDACHVARHGLTTLDFYRQRFVTGPDA